MRGADVFESGRGLSVEMKQRKHVKNIMLSEEGRDHVLFEGNLGQLLELSMVDQRVLEVKGVNGVLRIDLALEELEEMISKLRSKCAQSSKFGAKYKHVEIE